MHDWRKIFSLFLVLTGVIIFHGTQFLTAAYYQRNLPEIIRGIPRRLFEFGHYESVLVVFALSPFLALVLFVLFFMPKDLRTVSHEKRHKMIAALTTSIILLFAWSIFYHIAYWASLYAPVRPPGASTAVLVLIFGPIYAFVGLPIVAGLTMLVAKAFFYLTRRPRTD